MIATAILCGLVPMIGITLRNSAIVTTRETRVLQALSTWPEYLHDCSTVLAYMFSTIGCIMLLVILAAIDMRITGNKRIVIRDIVVSATPILYVTGIKWVCRKTSSRDLYRIRPIAGRSQLSKWTYGRGGHRIRHDDSDSTQLGL